MNHLVGSGEECFRDREAKRLSGLVVEDRFKPDRRLHWQFGRFFTPEDAIHVAGGQSIRLCLIVAKGDQSTGGDEAAKWIRRGQPVVCRECDNLLALELSPNLGDGRGQAAAA